MKITNLSKTCRCGKDPGEFRMIFDPNVPQNEALRSLFFDPNIPRSWCRRRDLRSKRPAFGSPVGSEFLGSAAWTVVRVLLRQLTSETSTDAATTIMDTHHSFGSPRGPRGAVGRLSASTTLPAPTPPQNCPLGSSSSNEAEIREARGLHASQTPIKGARNHAQPARCATGTLAHHLA